MMTQLKTSDDLYKPDFLGSVIGTIISGNFSTSFGKNLVNGESLHASRNSMVYFMRLPEATK